MAPKFRVGVSHFSCFSFQSLCDEFHSAILWRTLPNRACALLLLLLRVVVTTAAAGAGAGAMVVVCR